MRACSPLRLAILQSGLFQYEIAHRCGLSETTLSRVIAGRRSASANERRCIAQILGLSENELFKNEPVVASR